MIFLEVRELWDKPPKGGGSFPREHGPDRIPFDVACNVSRSSMSLAAYKRLKPWDYQVPTPVNINHARDIAVGLDSSLDSLACFPLLVVAPLPNAHLFRMVGKGGVQRASPIEDSFFLLYLNQTLSCSLYPCSPAGPHSVSFSSRYGSNSILAYPLYSIFSELFNIMPGGFHPPLSVIKSWPKPNYIDPPAKGHELVAISLSLGILATVAVAARIWVRVKIQKNPGLDDLFLVLSIVSEPECRASAPRWRDQVRFC